MQISMHVTNWIKGFMGSVVQELLIRISSY